MGFWYVVLPDLDGERTVDGHGAPSRLAQEFCSR